MYRPNMEEAKKIARESDYKRIPISFEKELKDNDPIDVLKVLKNVSKYCYMFESNKNDRKSGRFTFLGFDPVLRLVCNNNDINVTSGTEISIKTEKPGNYIQKLIDESRSIRFDYLPPFTGGLMGYFSYDYIKYSEPTLNLYNYDEEDFKDVDLMLFDKVIAFDHSFNKIILIANAKTNEIETEYNNAIMELEKISSLIDNGKQQVIEKATLKSEIKPLFEKDEYCHMVNKAKEHIREGDIFQVVLSNRFEAKIQGSLLDVYMKLRTTNPSPYMFYIYSNDLEIIGASPETLVRLEDKVLYTYPLAGTRRRGKNEYEDKMLELDLLSDAKELAEHNMLVDLARNDLGKISEFGSVVVDQYMNIEKFSHVMHIGSTVTSKIKSDKVAVDTVDAILPAGTLSGAPKIRACEIICELENNKRGIYGGAIGYLDFNGNVDTCIAIRLAYKKEDKVFVNSGAGIVADSQPDKEYEECINKSKALINAIQNI
ncbi:anthranilate synthase component I [Terrisporobacter glycolicus]|uniref:anthranilate synthase component I n=1 Tax=Terrisporobacter glycolicus TaxID=36841 RepID=UPI000AB452F0